MLHIYIYDISRLRVNNSNTNENIAMKFEQEYFRCVRNEEECVCSVCLFRCSIFIGFRIIKEMPGSVASGTPCINNQQNALYCLLCIFVGYLYIMEMLIYFWVAQSVSHG